MAYYRAQGSIPPKRHTQHRAPDGGLYYEELMGEEGFSSDSSLLYHRNIPSAIAESRAWDVGDMATRPNHPLTPRHLKLHDLFVDATERAGLDVVTGRRLVLGNGDVRLLYVVADTPSPFYRNGIGDECVYVERGGARVETVFGVFEVTQGDYLVIPRATTHRWIPAVEGDDGYTEPLRAYCIEATSHIGPPKRYLSKFGQLLEHAPYCERDLVGPHGPLLAEDIGAAAGEHTEVYLKHRGTGEGSSGGLVGTVHTLPFHPLDVVGWDGCLYPFVFNVSDFEPITGRVHQPPPVHQVFEGSGFVVCNFVPRKVDYHPLSIPVPYYHSNVDSDEIMFYVDGDYEARKGSGIGKGSISVHPGGHPHGPQPGATEASIGVEYFDELAVMVDTFRPLELGEAGRAVDDGQYAASWHRGLHARSEGDPADRSRDSRRGGDDEGDEPGSSEVFTTS
ncbi:MAG: homogentisate 1,2-dioxygenase [Actinobacteria bacterium]|nr:homogentisate 1,2-dioxygenase [Actinomycetota bacterium]